MDKIGQDLITIRKHLHANPEISGHEYKTARKIVEFISHYNPTTIIENVGGAGVLVSYDSGHPGPIVLFRAELDALPIHETNTFEYRSTIDNMSHKCGHDGHATILIGLAEKLSKRALTKGKIVLLFQPAEETGEGAKLVLSDPKFQDVKPDYVFALHNLPDYPMHQVVARKDSFTAAVKSVTIKLTGKTSHAAEPEKGINPALAIAKILKESISLSNDKPEELDFSVITPIHVEMGSKDFGISAGCGEVRLTVRTWYEDQLNLIMGKIRDIVQSISSEEKLESEILISHHFAANQNDPDAVDLIYNSAINAQLSAIHRPYPFKWGEDFGLFTQEYKGAMFGLGAGENTAALHNPDYDFPDEILNTGVNIFYQIITEIYN